MPPDHTRTSASSATHAQATPKPTSAPSNHQRASAASRRHPSAVPRACMLVRHQPSHRACACTVQWRHSTRIGPMPRQVWRTRRARQGGGSRRGGGALTSCANTASIAHDAQGREATVPAGTPRAHPQQPCTTVQRPARTHMHAPQPRPPHAAPPTPKPTSAPSHHQHPSARTLHTLPPPSRRAPRGHCLHDTSRRTTRLRCCAVLPVRIGRRPAKPGAHAAGVTLASAGGAAVHSHPATTRQQRGQHRRSRQQVRPERIRSSRAQPSNPRARTCTRLSLDCHTQRHPHPSRPTRHVRKGNMTHEPRQGQQRTAEFPDRVQALRLNVDSPWLTIAPPCRHRCRRE